MISARWSVTGRAFRHAPRRLHAADAGASLKFRRPCECRPADRGSVAEVLERGQHRLAAHRAFDGEQIASAAVEVDVHFADERDRTAFLDDYLSAVRALSNRYGSSTGLPYRVVMAAHPAIGQETEASDEQ